MQPNNTKQKVIAGSLIVVIVAVLLVSISAYEAAHKQTTSSSTSATASTAPSTAAGGTSTPVASPASQYKDGTYSATSQYSVPHSTESIRVTVTVKNDAITASDIVNSESDPESAQFQERFTAAYKTHVVGKNISDVNLSYIAGASDTTQGFDDALQSILNQAKV